MKTTEAARGRWRGIIQSMGVDPVYLDGKHHACPFCGGKDRFRFDDKEGNGTYICSGCGAGTGMRFVQNLTGWDFARAAHEVDGIIGRIQPDEIKKERSDEDKAKAMRRLLEASRIIERGCPAWNYLNSRCGDPGAILSDLRWHPGLKHSNDGGTFPAMLAVLRYANGKGASIHRTYLTKDGHKAPVDPVRMIMPGFPLEGSAVRLGMAQERLGIAEGIETAICAGKLFGMTVWSAISANGLIKWDPPEGVQSVVIFGDNDPSFTGQAAAYEKARSLRVKGFQVEVRIPDQVGLDWCDVWAACPEAA